MMTHSYEEKILELTKPFKVIMIYCAKADELETKNVIEKLLENKIVVIPKVIEKNTMICKAIKSTKELEVGKFGIMEPKEECKTILKDEIDIFFVPGKEFDMEGNRKGRGFGYFDRFLADVKKPIVGICRDNCFKDVLRVNEWDVPVNYVITDKRYKNIS